MALLKVIVIAVLVSPLPFVSANHYTAPLPKLQTPPPPTPVAPASYDQTKPNPGDQTQILKAIESLLLKRLNESFAHEDTTGRHVERWIDQQTDKVKNVTAPIADAIVESAEDFWRALKEFWDFLHRPSDDPFYIKYFDQRVAVII